MMPSSSYFAVVCSEGASKSSQPFFSTASSRLLSRPWLASRPAVALPLLYSRMSGASSELSTWLAVERICSKLLASNSTVAPVSSSKTLMASVQAMPIALVSLSKCQSVSVSLSASLPPAAEQPDRSRALTPRAARPARVFLDFFTAYYFLVGFGPLSGLLAVQRLSKRFDNREGKHLLSAVGLAVSAGGGCRAQLDVRRLDELDAWFDVPGQLGHGELDGSTA